MSASDIAAWWGAIAATAVLAWDIFKWKRTGVRLRLSLTANMQTHGNVPNSNPDARYVVVEVVNVGDKRTEITHLAGLYYKHWWRRLRGRNDKSFLVLRPAMATQFPVFIEPGSRWLGGIEQNQELEDLSRSGRLYCGVIHSAAKRPLVARLVIQQRSTGQPRGR